MSVGLGGADEANVPLLLVPAHIALDAPVLQSPVTKHQLEFIQASSYALALALTMPDTRPVAISRGDEPRPDFFFQTESARIAVEVTHLTIQQTRHELHLTRQLGQAVEQQLCTREHRVPHLVGRQVSLTVLDASQMPRQLGDLVDQITSGLVSEDRGYIGEGIDLSNGLPERWNDRGFYGDFGPVHVLVHANEVGEETRVTYGCQCLVTLDEVVAVLNDRIARKDCPQNEILLISVGAPDMNGNICPVDQFLFNFLREHIERVSLAPIHLRTVDLHLWGTAEMTRLFQASPL